MISKTKYALVLILVAIFLAACSGVVHKYEITDATGATYTIDAYSCASKPDPDYQRYDFIIVTCAVPVPEGEPAGIYANVYSPVKSLRLVK